MQEWAATPASQRKDWPEASNPAVSKNWDVCSGYPAAREAETAGLFSAEDGWIIRIAFRNRPAGMTVTVSGSVRCHECSTENRFSEAIAGAMMGTHVICAKCKSRINMRWRTISVADAVRMFICASPESATSGHPVRPNETLVDAVTE
jgi:hypothetical protein